MSAVLGIDLSTKALDLVKLDETTNHATWTRVDLTGKTALQRLRDIPAALRLNLPAGWLDDVYLAAIEAPMSHGQPGTLAKLSRVFGAVAAWLPPSLEVWEVDPQAWRKTLGLRGNANKEECAKAVRARAAVTTTTPASGWAITFDYTHESRTWPQDALDAYAVAYYARETNHQGITNTLRA